MCVCVCVNLEYVYASGKLTLTNPLKAFVGFHLIDECKQTYRIMYLAQAKEPASC